MRIDHRLLSWGVFFIALGAIPLAVRAGAVDSGTVAGAWRLWPLVFVGIGIGVILRGSRIALLGGLIVAVTFGLAGGGLMAGGSIDFGSIACGPRVATGPDFSRSGTFGPTASVRLEMRCGDLNVTTAPGGGWSVSGVSPRGQDPDFGISATNLSVDGRSNRTILPFGTDRDRWAVTLPQDPILDLSATVNAGEGALDLRSAHLATVDMTVNAGSTRLDLTGATADDVSVTVNAGDLRIVLPADSLAGSFTVNAGSIRFCTPPDVGLRITTSESIVASYDFANAGLVKDGSTWTSPNYATANERIELSATANAGSISLNPKDGCR